MHSNDPLSTGDVTFGALVLRFLDGDLSPQEHAELAQRLADDEAAREQYVSLCIDAGQMVEILKADELTTGEFDEGDFDEDEVLVTPVALEQPRLTLWQRLSHPMSISLAVSAIAVSAMLAVLAWKNAPVERPMNVRWASTPDEAPLVARLVRSPDARWADGAAGYADGTLLGAGELLDLESGTVDVIFNDGAQVTLKGPVQFYVTDSDRGQLIAGRLTGYVPPHAVGFSVRTRQVEVVDLGTEFGVLTSPGETEVHVFQGAVRVEAYHSETRRTLKAGESLKVLPNGTMQAQAAAPGEFQRRLPPDVAATGAGNGATIVENFDNSSSQASGWAGAWSLHGAGRVQRDVEEPFDDQSGPYLHVSPTNAEVRTLRREYGKFGDVDPSQPHIIRWKWRYDGNPAALTNFHDRIHFFADSEAYPGTTFSSAWLIAIAFGVEREAQPPVGKWVFFHSRKSGQHSDAFAERNMINTGMSLRPGAVYSFEVRVDPAAGTYDATIDDGVEKFSAAGMHFRSGKRGPSPVLHFGGCASAAKEDQSFSLDSIEIVGVK